MVVWSLVSDRIIGIYVVHGYDSVYEVHPSNTNSNVL